LTSVVVTEAVVNIVPSADCLQSMYFVIFSHFSSQVPVMGKFQIVTVLAISRNLTILQIESQNFPI